MNKKHSTDCTASSSPTLTASCHCRSVSLPVYPRIPTIDGKLPIGVPLCHCSTCRHSTGLLCTSYMPISLPLPSALAKTTAYPTRRTTPSPSNNEGFIQRYFCSTCGCHLFRSRTVQDTTPEGVTQDKGGKEWEVATGVLNNVITFVHVSHHENISDTKDGGLSIFITEQNHRPLPVSPDSVPEQREANLSDPHKYVTATQTSPVQSQYQSPPSQMKISDNLPAECACGTVKFHISRPNTSSILPHSPFPDLMMPYHTKDPVIPNPDDAKWWLRAPTTEFPTGSKYLAGTCACRSCRLTSGFEIQTWAFVPRANIYFHVPRGLGTLPGHDTSESEELIIPLEFSELRRLESAGSAVLRSYESSPGVMREFCPTCGATVFWHDKHRPELIDVSVGLLDAPEGARAEEWLEWWLARVSFEEDAGREREGSGKEETAVEAEGWNLIPALKRGLGRGGGSVSAA